MEPNLSARAAGLHCTFWRLHFWAGLVTAPIVLFAAVTGLQYALTPQIEAAVPADVDRVPVGKAPAPLDAQLAAAREVRDGAAPRAIVPAHRPGETTQVFFAAPPSPHAGHGAAVEHDHGLPQGRIVYVNRYTAQVVDDLAVQMQLALPMGEGGVWRVDNFDRAQPDQRFALLLDAGSGQVLYRSGCDGLPLIPKAKALGIPFHRAEFGVWNQIVLVLAALATIFSVLSGVVMWWQRRPKGRFSAPAVSRQQLRAVPLALWGLVAAMAWAMPVFGISFAIFLGLELGAAQWRRLRGSNLSF